jgi:hypothetical protein
MEVENEKLLILDINYKEPISDIDYKKGLEVMKSKMNSIYTNQV